MGNTDFEIKYSQFEIENSDYEVSSELPLKLVWKILELDCKSVKYLAELIFR